MGARVLYKNINQTRTSIDTKKTPQKSDIPDILEKISLYPFKKNNPAFCPISQTNQGNAPLLKLDFLKIKLSPIVTFLRIL